MENRKCKFELATCSGAGIGFSGLAEDFGIISTSARTGIEPGREPVFLHGSAVVIVMDTDSLAGKIQIITAFLGRAGVVCVWIVPRGTDAINGR
jgi:hypothetical protein